MSENDLYIISLARQKSLYDSGWEQLENRCESEEARLAVRRIEAHKYRVDEHSMDMM